jgi:D-alanine-D-alanine ligase
MTKPKIRIALLRGGRSGEREISLLTGQKIAQALDKDRYEVTQYDPRDDLNQFLKDWQEGKFDLVFPALHGPYGEDGRLQGLMDTLGVPYLFSGCLASALAMHKHKTKAVLEKAGIPVLPDRLLVKDKSYDIGSLPLPAVIKPVEMGSSVGISIAKTKDELAQGIEAAFAYDHSVMVEKYAKGRELTVAVLGNQPPEALPVIEIIPRESEWFDYKAKYQSDATEEICPAGIPEEVRDKVQSYALTAFRALGCQDLARADFIWSDGGELYCLEVNTIPGMTDASLVPKAAQAAGLSFSQFLDKLIQIGLERIKKINP